VKQSKNRLRTLFDGFNAHSTSECTVFVRNEPCASAKIAWYTAVWRCKRLVILFLNPECVQFATKCLLTDKACINEREIESIPFAFSFGTFIRCGTYDASPEKLCVLHYGVKSDMNHRKMYRELRMSVRLHVEAVPQLLVFLNHHFLLLIGFLLFFAFLVFHFQHTGNRGSDEGLPRAFPIALVTDLLASPIVLRSRNYRCAR
jgi:hypothetical protein